MIDKLYFLGDMILIHLLIRPRDKKKLFFMLNSTEHQLYPPPPEPKGGGGDILFLVRIPSASACLSVRYLLNLLMDFDQTCI